MLEQASSAAAAASASTALVTALGPAFASGFAVQQLLEILDPIASAIKWTPPQKKVAVSLVSLVVGCGIAYVADLHVLQSLESRATQVPGDWVITGIVISAGTEGLNSIMKFLGYSKEAKKGEAAQKLKTAPADELAKVDRPSKEPTA